MVLNFHDRYIRHYPKHLPYNALFPVPWHKLWLSWFAVLIVKLDWLCSSQKVVVDMLKQRIPKKDQIVCRECDAWQSTCDLDFHQDGCHLTNY